MKIGRSVECFILCKGMISRMHFISRWCACFQWTYVLTARIKLSVERFTPGWHGPATWLEGIQISRKWNQPAYWISGQSSLVDLCCKTCPSSQGEACFCCSFDWAAKLITNSRVTYVKQWYTVANDKIGFFNGSVFWQVGCSYIDHSQGFIRIEMALHTMKSLLSLCGNLEVSFKDR